MTLSDQSNTRPHRLDQLVQILLFDLRAIYLPVLAIPLLVSAGVIWIYSKNVWWINEEWLVNWEIAGIIVPGIAFGIALVRWGIQRQPYWGWLAGLAGVFFCREIHFTGTNVLIYTAPLVLLLVAWLMFDHLADYLTNPGVVTMLVILGMFYTITQSLDAHLFEFLPQERLWEKGAEETLEVIGHTVLVCLAIFSRPRREGPDTKPAIPRFLRETPRSN